MLRFDAFSGLNKGISGSLYCTNFKVSFVTANRPPENMVSIIQRLLKSLAISGSDRTTIRKIKNKAAIALYTVNLVANK